MDEPTPNILPAKARKKGCGCSGGRKRVMENEQPEAAVPTETVEPTKVNEQTLYATPVSKPLIRQSGALQEAALRRKKRG